ncbi:hypothetical protein HY967_02265 [Candidatus Jorgensenbacteria bacterium]|nr:hypothetical protein [Candidatus Jorgensenbacteria bacterium]
MLQRTSAIAIIVLLFIITLIWPRAFDAFHHYLNFIALGRSNTKVLGFFIWFILIFALPFLRFRIIPKTIESAMKWLMGMVLGLAAIGPILSFILIVRNRLPLDTIFYSVDERFNMSFNHIAHTHFLKPVVAFLGQFINNADFGEPWIQILSVGFNVPLITLHLIYAVIFLVLILFTSVALFYSLRYSSITMKLLYAFVSFSFLKGVVDGGLLNPELLVSLSFLLFLINKWRYSLFSLPFLVFDYFIWFAPAYIETRLIQLLLFLGLSLFALTPMHKKDRSRLIVVGIAALTAFIYFGGTHPFFGQTPLSFGQEIIPGGREIYFIAKNQTYPSRLLLDRSMSLSDFGKTYNARIEYEPNSSVKVKSITCDAAQELIMFGDYKVIDPSNGLVREMSRRGTWHRVQSKGDATQFILNSCFPNPFSSSLRLIKEFYIKSQAVIIALPHPNRNF